MSKFVLFVGLLLYSDIRFLISFLNQISCYLFLLITLYLFLKHDLDHKTKPKLIQIDLKNQLIAFLGKEDWIITPFAR